MKLEELFAHTDRDNLVVELTPEMATDWIDHCNTHNRKLVDSHVEYLVEEMKAGRWRLTHQGIAFSSNRVLLDGQHRLWAAALAGITVPIRVFVNEPPEAMEVLDTGQRRRNDQILSLTAGLGDVTCNELSTLRAMYLGIGLTRRRSPGDEGTLLARHLDAVRFALACLGHQGRVKNVATAVTRAVLARAWYSADHAQLRHFADVLMSGRPIGEHDEPIMLLFQALARMAGNRKAASRRECYGLAERALAAFLGHERLARLYPARQELFPLPEETQPAAA
ncbi:MAG TPA: hypothetical protein PLP66_03610 [Phycisphaerae bacterium]|nr:hypothetical protein [Phycisphaerae bacterium]HPM22963.1 hypothetical protein [Phycisphaerae bacterium]